MRWRRESDRARRTERKPAERNKKNTHTHTHTRNKTKNKKNERSTFGKKGGERLARNAWTRRRRRKERRDEVAQYSRTSVGPREEDNESARGMSLVGAVIVPARKRGKRSAQSAPSSRAKRRKAGESGGEKKKEKPRSRKENDVKRNNSSDRPAWPALRQDQRTEA